MSRRAGCYYDDLLRDIREEFPAFRLVPKESSWLMRAIDIALKVITFGAMSTFMTGYVSVIGSTVYVSRGWAELSDMGRAVVLRHERVHMRQRAKYGPLLFTFLYLFFPLPVGLAYFRMKFEREAYEETLRARVELYGPKSLRDPECREGIVRQFTSSAYFWMWPFRKNTLRWYQAASKAAFDSRPAIM